MAGMKDPRPALSGLLAAFLLLSAACHDDRDRGPDGPTFFLSVYPNASADGTDACLPCAEIPLDLWIDGEYLGGLREPVTIPLPFTGMEYEILAGSTQFRFLYRDFSGGESMGYLLVVRCGCAGEGGDCSRVLSMQSAHRFKSVPCDRSAGWISR
jgi:hypothetical protein